MAAILLLFLSLSLSHALFATETVHIAVASNFADTLRVLAALFGAALPESKAPELKISAASTGKLFAQIRHGAPFDVFLSADAKRPQLLVADGYAVAGSLFTYAVGRLALWQPLGIGDALNGPEILGATSGPLAIANPKTAPYGKAAQETLRALGLWKTWQPRLVRGENIGQTYQFVASGAAALGFVALSQVLSMDRTPMHRMPTEGQNPAQPKGQRWIVPSALHSPLWQQAVLLNRGLNNTRAKDFMAFLRSPKAREIIENQGYQLPDL